MWNSIGVLPPIQPGVEGISRDRSPYCVDLSAFVNRFCISQERKNILIGLLNFRHDLHDLGITTGFQWLNGSFSENIEITEQRPPMDIDVVTFFDLPSGENQQSLLTKAPDLFQPARLKKKYLIDGYYIGLGRVVDERYVRNVSYWYSMWSHRRDNVWKGFVQVSLAPSGDSGANQLLNAWGM